MFFRELASSGNPPIYPMIESNKDILSKSIIYYSNCIISMFTASYSIYCNNSTCYAYDNCMCVSMHA